VLSYLDKLAGDVADTVLRRTYHSRCSSIVVIIIIIIVVMISIVQQMSRRSSPHQPAGLPAISHRCPFPPPLHRHSASAPTFCHSSAPARIPIIATGELYGVLFLPSTFASETETSSSAIAERPRCRVG